MNDGGKGSKPRPLSVSEEEYAARWDMIFCRDQKEKVQESSDELKQEESKVSPWCNGSIRVSKTLGGSSSLSGDAKQ